MTKETLSLQSRAGEWHRARFPNADPGFVALKMTEEHGELASAVIGYFGTASATGKGDVGAEAADVAITLFSLLDRWFPEVNLIAEIEKKLSILEDPDSGHPASERRSLGDEGDS